MNIITIDPSLTSTAMIINDKKFLYVSDHNIMTSACKLKRWFGICDQFITYRPHNFVPDSNYSNNEVKKLKEYNSITDKIINDIKNNINNNNSIIFGIEGYSYSSKAGPLIDLVTFSTLLRNKLMQFQHSSLLIKSPSTLKLDAAKLTYEPEISGKKVKKYQWRNHEGISGGKFTKFEIYKSLIDNLSLQDDEWIKMLIAYAGDILSAKSVPKPIDDMNDAKVFYEVLKKQYT